MTSWAMRDTMQAVQSYVQQHPEFSEIGGRMLTEWEQGIALSLQVG